jgi:hypothetical protein
MEVEIWKDVVGWEGKYQISSFGGVRSLVNQKTKLPVPKATSLDINGYPVVPLYNKCKLKLRKVHRLVAEAFIPNNQNKPFVNHKDGIKTNSKLSNLEWVTAKENSHHAHENNLVNPARGEASGIAIWTDAEVIAIKTDINLGLNNFELFSKYPKLNTKHLYLFRKNKTWKHLPIRALDIKSKIFRNKDVKYKHLEAAVLEFLSTNSASQQKAAEHFSIPQSIVSKMVRGCYKNSKT